MRCRCTFVAALGCVLNGGESFVDVQNAVEGGFYLLADGRRQLLRCNQQNVLTSHSTAGLDKRSSASST